MRKIIKVKALNFILECEMENGELFEYDMSFLKNSEFEMTKSLRKLKNFQQVFLELGSLSWPNGYEIHANTVVREATLISKAAS